MVKVVLIANKKIALPLIDLTEEIIGEKSPISVIEDLNIPKNNDGVIILTDMLGQTYSNKLLKICKKNDNLRLISGVNIPMLISASKYALKAETSLERFTQNVLDDSKKAIISNKEFFGAYDD